jgi:Na+/H+-translocating membrane pyrophosphatase
MLAQFATTVLGIGAMVMVAQILTWYQKTDRQPGRAMSAAGETGK